MAWKIPETMPDISNPVSVLLGIVGNYIEMTKDLREKLESLCKSASSLEVISKHLVEHLYKQENSRINTRGLHNRLLEMNTYACKDHLRPELN